MKSIVNRISKATGKSSLFRDERGLSSVEYVVLLVLIVGAAIALWVNIRDDVTSKITDVHNSMQNVNYGKQP